MVSREATIFVGYAGYAHILSTKFVDKRGKRVQKLRRRPNNCLSRCSACHSNRIRGSGAVGLRQRLTVAVKASDKRHMASGGMGLA